jgi:hypothetical protein
MSQESKNTMTTQKIISATPLSRMGGDEARIYSRAWAGRGRGGMCVSGCLGKFVVVVAACRRHRCRPFVQVLP